MNPFSPSKLNDIGLNKKLKNLSRVKSKSVESFKMINNKSSISSSPSPTVRIIRQSDPISNK